MAKFNVKKFVKNYEGAKAIKISDKSELVKLCLTSFLEKTFYETAEETMERIIAYAKWVDQDFLLKLAIFSRDYGLRSINHLLAAIYIVNNSGKTWVRQKFSKFLNKMIRRPDEMGEILGAFNALIESEKTIIPNILKVSFKELLETKFDKFQLQKYKNKWDFKLHDIVNLVHAHNDNIDLLMKWDIGTADTWESRLSAGQDKWEAFGQLIAENKLWSKALLMNIRNILEWGVDQTVLAEYINKANVKWIFPFDIMKAIWAVSSNTIQQKINNKIITALEEMALRAYGDLPLEGKVAVICDISRSMTLEKMSDKSGFCPADVAAFYTALAYVSGWDTWVFTFASTAEELKMIAGDSVWRVFNEIRKNMNWGWTNVQSAIDMVKDKYDTALIFTDGQFADEIKNTGNLKQVILANFVGYKNCNMTKWNILEISWYSDIMLKYSSDLKNISWIITQIEAVNYH